jgi:hypothetical protein
MSALVRVICSTRLRSLTQVKGSEIVFAQERRAL